MFISMYNTVENKVGHTKILKYGNWNILTLGIVLETYFNIFSNMKYNIYIRILYLYIVFTNIPIFFLTPTHFYCNRSNDRLWDKDHFYKRNTDNCQFNIENNARNNFQVVKKRITHFHFLSQLNQTDGRNSNEWNRILNQIFQSWPDVIRLLLEKLIYFLKS